MDDQPNLSTPSDSNGTGSTKGSCPEIRLRTDPSGFVNPHTRANKVGRMLWSVVWRLFFRSTPPFAGKWRRFLLRTFNAQLGRAWLHSNVEVWAPWRLEIGDDVYIDRQCQLYNASGIRIGNRVTISRGVFLCSSSHDYTITTFPLIGGRITVGDDCWIAADAFVGPGVTIGEGSVVGARSVVIRDVPPWTVVAGNPARIIRKRELRKADERSRTDL